MPKECGDAERSGHMMRTGRTTTIFNRIDTIAFGYWVLWHFQPVEANCQSISNLKQRGLLHYEICISCGSHDHVNAVPSHWLWVGCKRITEDNKLPSSDHPRLPLCLNYIVHIHAGCRGVVTMTCNSGLRGLGYGSRLLGCSAASLGMTFHLHVHSLDPGRERVPGRTLTACVWIVTWAPWWRQGCYNAPQGVKLVLEWTGL